MTSFEFDLDNLVLKISNLAVEPPNINVPPLPKTKVTKNIAVVSDILKALCIENVDDYLELLNKGLPYELKTLEGSCIEYIRIDFSFRQTLNSLKDRWRIVRIDKVLCPYLLCAFLLMQEKKQKYYLTVQQHSLYHGTWTRNIPSICEGNFNWRLQGSAKGHKFGQGMSFAKRSTYACHYPNICSDNPRTLFLAQVSVATTVPGNANTTVPPEGCDTTSKGNLDVLVKFDDADYFPKYIIYYSL